MKRRLISLFLVIMLFGCSVASATDYGTPGGGVYSYVGGVPTSTRYYKVYRDSTARDRIYENKKLTLVIKHNKNTGSDQLTFSKSQSLSYESVVNYNTSFGITVTAPIVSATVNAGCGTSNVAGRTVNVASEVTKTIPSDANTGYYARALGRTYNNIKVVSQENNSRYYDTYYYEMPYGDPVVYTIYSPSNAYGSFGVY